MWRIADGSFRLSPLPFVSFSHCLMEADGMDGRRVPARLCTLWRDFLPTRSAAARVTCPRHRIAVCRSDYGGAVETHSLCNRTRARLLRSWLQVEHHPKFHERFGHIEQLDSDGSGQRQLLTIACALDPRAWHERSVRNSRKPLEVHATFKGECGNGSDNHQRDTDH